MTIYVLLKKIGLIECIFGKHFIYDDQLPNHCAKCGLIK